MSEYLDKTVENRLVAIGNKRYYKVFVLTVVWIVGVVALWLTFMLLRTDSFALIPNYIPLVLCGVPFFPFSAHKILFSKTFYATVNYKMDYTQFQQLKEAYVRERPDTVEALSIKFKSDEAVEFTVIYRKKNYVNDGIHYDNGDRVLFVRGIKYPVKIPITDATARTCPLCGRTVEAKETVCKRCGFDYSSILKQ